MAEIDEFDTIGGYRRVALIGRGGMGEVWLAVDPATMKPCALKLLLPEFASNEEYRAMFYREASIASQLGGRDGFVGVRNVGEDQGLLYLSMDLVDGVNLHRFVRKIRKAGGQLPIPLVIHVMRVVLRGLRAAHGLRIAQREAGVVHGDIKPPNIIVASNGSIWITDLGIARFTPREGTITWRPMGTLRYMAPEQYEGLICPQSDLYSAGVTMHELLEGKPMIPKGSPEELRKRIREGSAPKLERTVPSSVAHLLAGLVEKDLERRTQSASEALERVKGIERELGIGDLQDEMAALYGDVIGPPRSGLTLFLQNLDGLEDEQIGSFLPAYIRRAAEVDRQPPATPAPTTVAPAAVAPAEADGVPVPRNPEASAPWMLEDAGAPEATSTLRVGSEPEAPPVQRTAPLTIAAPPHRAAPAIVRTRATPADRDVPTHAAHPDPAAARRTIPDGPAWVAPAAPYPDTVEVTETAPTRRERRTIGRLLVFAGLLSGLMLGVGAFVLWPRADDTIASAAVAIDAPPRPPVAPEPFAAPAPSLEISADPEPPPSPEPAGDDARPPAPPGDASSRPTADTSATPAPDPSPAPAGGSNPGTANTEPAGPPEDPAATQHDAPAPAAPSAAPRDARAKKPTRARPSPEKKASRKVTVYFFPGRTDAAQIRVGRRQLTVDWIATAKLRPGRHKVSWRKRESDTWTPAGKIDLGPLSSDQFYEVRLKGMHPTVVAKRRKRR